MGDSFGVSSSLSNIVHLRTTTNHYVKRMPTYEYQCSLCGNIQEEVRLMDFRADSGECQNCSGKTSRIMLTPPNVQAFAGSDRLRSHVDKWANMVEEVQREGVHSNTEIDVGMAQAEDRAKKQGMSVEKILGPQGKKKPKITAEIKADMRKRALAQNKLHG